MSLTALGLPNPTIYAFKVALQGVVAAVVGEALPSPYLAAPTGKVTTLSLLHLRFM